MTDLNTLQYPRHVHKGGAWKIVHSPDECDVALDAGWVLSPGDDPRRPALDAESEVQPADEVTDVESSTVADVPEPDAPKSRRAARPHLSTRKR